MFDLETLYIFPIERRGFLFALETLYLFPIAGGGVGIFLNPEQSPRIKNFSELGKKGVFLSEKNLCMWEIFEVVFL